MDTKEKELSPEEQEVKKDKLKKKEIVESLIRQMETLERDITTLNTNIEKTIEQVFNQIKKQVSLIESEDSASFDSMVNGEISKLGGNTFKILKKETIRVKSKKDAEEEIRILFTQIENCERKYIESKLKDSKEFREILFKWKSVLAKTNEQIQSFKDSQQSKEFFEEMDISESTRLNLSNFRESSLIVPSSKENLFQQKQQKEFQKELDSRIKEAANSSCSKTFIFIGSLRLNSKNLQDFIQKHIQQVLDSIIKNQTETLLKNVKSTADSISKQIAFLKKQLP